MASYLAVCTIIPSCSNRVFESFCKFHHKLLPEIFKKIRDSALNFVQSAPEQPTLSRHFVVNELFFFIRGSSPFLRSAVCMFGQHELKVQDY